MSPSDEFFLTDTVIMLEHLKEITQEIYIDEHYSSQDLRLVYETVRRAKEEVHEQLF